MKRRLSWRIALLMFGQALSALWCWLSGWGPDLDQWEKEGVA